MSKESIGIAVGTSVTGLVLLVLIVALAIIVYR